MPAAGLAGAFSRKQRHCRSGHIIAGLLWGQWPCIIDLVIKSAGPGRVSSQDPHLESGVKSCE